MCTHVFEQSRHRCHHTDVYSNPTTAHSLHHLHGQTPAQHQTSPSAQGRVEDTGLREQTTHAGASTHMGDRASAATLIIASCSQRYTEYCKNNGLLAKCRGLILQQVYITIASCRNGVSPQYCTALTHTARHPNINDHTRRHRHLTGHQGRALQYPQ